MSLDTGHGFDSALRCLARAAFIALAAAVLAVPAVPAAAGYSAIVVDAATGKVLYESRADRSNYPASLAKMMTLYLTFEALEAGQLRLTTPLKVSRRASRQPSSKLALRAGRTITVEQAILGVATKSANDAATVLAEAIAGTEARFAERMTIKAREIGMSRTTFRNASGLHNRRQVTTARDMVVLAQALISDFPRYYHYFGTLKFTYQGNTFVSHNKLLKSYRGADGIKTGYIRASGFNLVASARRDGRRLIGVVMGDRSPRSRNARMRKLLDAAFLEQTALGAALVPKPVINPDGTLSPSSRGWLAKAPAPRERVVRSRTGWGIQVGAFARFAPAHLAVTRAARNAPDLLLRTRIVIEPVKEKDGTIYRARLVGLTETRAREACATLAAKRIGCVAVPPGDSLSVALAQRPKG